MILLSLAGRRAGTNDLRRQRAAPKWNGDSASLDAAGKMKSEYSVNAHCVRIQPRPWQENARSPCGAFKNVGTSVRIITNQASSLAFKKQI
jgi:hypothetical protein